MRSQKPIKLIAYFPQTEDGQLELSKRVSTVHADAVTARLKKLNCPNAQKLALLDAVIATVKENICPGLVHKWPQA